ncbi:MAG: ArsC family reductase [Glaciecola sp.]
MTTMYGIANCDTIKKAKRWLADHNIEFVFVDYKKQAPDPQVLQQAIDKYGIDAVVNKRGTTYRKLSDEQKSGITDTSVINVLLENTSMIKRPILTHNTSIIIGFSETTYKECFNID